MDPEQAARIVGFGYEAGQLKRLPRAGWLFAGIAGAESVAEHSFRVALLAYLIAALEGADPERAAVLGLFHDLPETRIGDVPLVGKAYVRTADPCLVNADQVAGLPAALASRIAAVIAEHESAKGPEPSAEARCSRDADKLELLLQAREYQAQGNGLMQPFIESARAALVTATGRALAESACRVDPTAWWETFANKPRTVD
jgi:putative hydrolase of HD superfamily